MPAVDEATGRVLMSGPGELALSSNGHGGLVTALASSTAPEIIRNRGLKFLGQPVYVRVENSETLFTHAYDAGQILHLHIAHGEGNYVADADTLAELESSRRVVFRYVNAQGEPVDAGNPNGSTRNIAGILNASGNVLGLMPHPERSVEALHGSTHGLGIFESLRDAVESGRAERRLASAEAH